MSKVRFLIISDIHAMSEDLEQLGGYVGRPGGRLRVEYRDKIKNLVLAIPSSLQDFRCKIDGLICLGDIAHQAKRLPLLQTWTDINQIAADLNIPQVLSVTGNHDKLSRAEDADKIEEMITYLQALYPMFPSPNLVFSEHYHTHGYAHLEIEKCGIICIDTCKLHGLGGENVGEILGRGHLTNDAIEKTCALIKASDCHHYIIAMHHHPVRLDPIKDSDYDQIKNGEIFIQELKKTGKKLIIVHGHKHCVSLTQANTQHGDPIVFSASSLAAYPYRDAEPYFTNMFHVLEIDLDNKGKMCGNIYTWNWSGRAWEKSKDSKMPYQQSFGIIPNILNITSQIESISFTSFLSKDELLRAVPEIEFVSSVQIDLINENLSKGKSGYNVLITPLGEIKGVTVEVPA